MQTLFDVIRQLLRQVADVSSSGGKTSAWTEHAKPVGVVQTDMPRPGSSHRKPAQDKPVGIERSRSVLNGFEDIGFTSPAVGIVSATVDFQLNIAQVARRITSVRGNELGFGQ